VPAKVLKTAGLGVDEASAALHALEHALRAVFPFAADVDPGTLALRSRC